MTRRGSTFGPLLAALVIVAQGVAAFTAWGWF